MRTKVFRASFFVSILICLVTIGMTAFLMFRAMEQQSFDDLAEEAEMLSSLQVTPGSLADIRSTRRITLVDSDGTVLYDNEADVAKMPNHSGREEIREALKNGSGESVRKSDTMLTETLYYALRLSDGQVLRMAVSQDSIWAVFASLARPAVVLFMCAVLLSLFLSGRVTDSILKPINSIDLDHPEENETYAEIRPLLKKISDQQAEILAQQRDELQKEEAYRREYTANISHELKTPLTSISGFAELMMQGGVPEDMVRDFSGTIYSEAGRLISLVNDIIQLSRLDDETASYQWDEIDLYELSRSVIRRLQPLADQRKIRMRLSGQHCTVLCVSSVMEEIVYNVTDNAVKYNHDGGSVRIEVEPDGKDAVVTVRDTGVGIPENEIPRIFERFYRVDKSHSREIGGTGLGLSIVKHGARLHHMDIQVSSTVGKGTTVTMRIPVTQPEKARDAHRNV